MSFSPSQKLKMSLLVLLSIAIFAPVSSFAAGGLVIDEFQLAGKDAYDEYLVVANYGQSPILMNGYKIVKYTAAGNESPIFSSFNSFVLNAGSKVMLCYRTFQGEKLSDTFVYSSDSMAANNAVAILDNKGGTVDLVGHGGTTEKPVTMYEGAAIVTSPSPNQVLARRNGYDSGNNRMDFQLLVKPVVVDLNADKLVIGELLPNPATGEEWFELYNPTNLPISMANLKVCDVLGATHCYFFDKADTIAANSYKVYNQTMTKITLNNDGDWLELYDIADNLLTDSGGNYGAADKGLSLSVFGNEYRWTATLTPGVANVFTDIIEVEEEVAPPKAKTTKSKVTAAAKKTVAAKASAPGASDEEIIDSETAVKAAKIESPLATIQKALVNKKTLGWALIGLAILLVVGYTCWYFRDYAKEIYHKIRPGDGSARF